MAWTVLRRLRGEVANAGPDERLQAVLQRTEQFLQGVPPSTEDLGAELVVRPRLKIGDQVIRTVSMVARFGSARELTLDQLRVELVFPGEAEAEAFFRHSAQVTPDAPA